ncbi:MAG: ABC transporter permease [Peptococcaceae bacterium]|nr:ABC transporter permease [Peptococcaceae bacterium]
MKPLEYMSYVTPASGEVFLKDAAVVEINNIDMIDKVYSVTIQHTGFTSLIGSASSLVVIPNNVRDISQIMGSMGIEAAGRLPQEGDSYEIIMNERLLKNKGLKIGDFIENGINGNETLSGRYKIVGSFSKDIMVSFANKSAHLESLKQNGMTGDNPTGLLLIPKAGQLEKMNDRLETINRKDTTVVTYSSQNKIRDDELASLNRILSLVVFAVLLILSISISAMIYVLYLSRNEEFGIIHAMGYQKSFIRDLILKEIISLSAVCWICGYVFSFVILAIFNQSLLAPKGQTLYFFTFSGLVYTLMIPVFVVICAAVPILRRLKKWDPITVIERRE